MAKGAKKKRIRQAKRKITELTKKGVTGNLPRMSTSTLQTVASHGTTSQAGQAKKLIPKRIVNGVLQPGPPKKVKY